MRIVLVGAGNLATNLGCALKEAGEELVGVYSHTECSASLLGNRLGVPYTTDLSKLPDDACLYIVSLKDSVLTEVLPKLVKGRENALFVHTAGSVPLAVWKDLVPRGGVLYPMQTFSKERIVCFKEIPCFVEASNKDDEARLCALASKLSHRVTVLDSDKRKYLHLAAVFACNFTNEMYGITAQILGEQGIPFDVMYPLIDETVSKVHLMSPLQAQTGPAVRYDRNVMSRHLALLQGNSEWQDLYERISKCIHYDQLRFKKDKSDSI